MGLFSILKKNSKLALKGVWGRAILILLLIFGVSVLITILHEIALAVFIDGPEIYDLLSDFLENPVAQSITPEILEIVWVEWIIIGAMSLLSLLFVTPLTLGATRWFFKLVHGDRMQVVEMFHFFETMRGFGRSIWCYINIGFRAMLWAIPFFTVPYTILGVSIYFLSGGGEVSRSSSAIASTGIFLAGILMLLVSVFYAACINRYALAPYFLAENDDVTVRRAIRDSVAYTKGFRFSLLWFDLSFIGWGLLCILVLPLLFYVTPYYYTAYAMYARYIIERNRYSEPNATKEFVAAPDDARIEQTPPGPVEPAQIPVLTDEDGDMDGGADDTDDNEDVRY